MTVQGNMEGDTAKVKWEQILQKVICKVWGRNKHKLRLMVTKVLNVQFDAL